MLGVICAIILLSLRVSFNWHGFPHLGLLGITFIQALNRTGWFESVEGQECNSNVQRFMNSRYCVNVGGFATRMVSLHFTFEG